MGCGMSMGSVVGGGWWVMGDGQWAAVGDGEWAIGAGQWEMGAGQWAMGDGTQRGSGVPGLLTSIPTASKGQDCACGCALLPRTGLINGSMGEKRVPVAWRRGGLRPTRPASHGSCGEVQRLFAKEGGAAATKGGAAFGFGAEGCSAAGEECADRRQQEPATPPLLPRVENHGNDYTEAWQYNHVQRIRMEKQNRPLRCGFVPTVGRTPSGPREPIKQQRRPQWLHREQPPLPPTPTPRPPPPQ